MTKHEMDVLDAFLFSADASLVDLKCFRGDRADVSETEIRDQIHSAFMQKKMGRAKVSKSAPSAGVSVVDVAAFVASL